MAVFTAILGVAHPSLSVVRKRIIFLCVPPTNEYDRDSMHSQGHYIRTYYLRAKEPTTTTPVDTTTS